MGNVTTLAALVDQGVLSMGDGHRAKLDELGGGGPFFLRAGALSERGFAWDGLDSFAGARGLEKKLGRPDDVVITTKGNSIGRVGFVPAEAPTFVYSPHLSYWRSIDQSVVVPRYLYYWAKSAHFSHQLRGLGFGTDMAPYLSLRDQARLVIDLPEQAQQEAVAHILGALDDKVAIIDRVAGTARELARTLYNRAVAGAKTAAMSNMLAPILGGTPSRADASLWDGSVPWASAKDITSATHGVVVQTSEGISAQAASAKRLHALPAGSVVLTARGTIGAVARLGIAASINQSCYGFVPAAVPTACLAFVVENAAAQASSMAHGSVFDTITMQTFDHVIVPQLGAADWAEIESKIAPLLAATQQAVKETVHLDRTRDELLPLLISGEVRVKDLERAVGDAI